MKFINNEDLQKLVILVGTRKAIRIAVKNDKTTQRHTALDWRLQK